jgi:hypothetical protein
LPQTSQSAVSRASNLQTVICLYAQWDFPSIPDLAGSGGLDLHPFNGIS